MPRFSVLIVFVNLTLGSACGEDPVVMRGDTGVDTSRVDSDATFADVPVVDVGVDGGSQPDASVPDALAPDPDASIPGPDASAPDPDVGPMGPVDELDVSSVIWLYPDISGWPITSELTVSLSGSTVCMEYDKKNEWPVVQIFGTTDVVANAWVFAQSSGQWYAATFEWLRPGQVCKEQSAVDGLHIKRDPFGESSGWTPSSGDELYFMVSGLIRSPSYSNVMERTNIVRVTWP